MTQAKRYNAYLKKQNKRLGTFFEYVSEGEEIDFVGIVETAVRISQLEMLDKMKFIMKPVFDAMAEIEKMKK
jgi:hypothetical protein